jgi:5-oxoprolinase (ATP-hydrolysing)
MIKVWCDVGGTFTDTIVEAIDSSGQVHRSRIKVLSSGVVHAKLIDWIAPDRIRVDVEATCDNFWIGAEILFLSLSNTPAFTSRVVSFDIKQSVIQLAEAIDLNVIAWTGDCDLIAGIEAPVLATRMLLGVPLNKPLPDQLDIRLGTTRGTNALLTRRGSKVAFVTTAPFRDLLLIGNQDRPDLFALAVKKRQPLYHNIIEVNERVLADGSIELPIDQLQVAEQMVALKASGIESIAICLMNAYKNPTHEQVVAKIARQLGFAEVSISSELSPLAKLVERSETTVVDAYLGPVVRSYLHRVFAQFGSGKNTSLRVMTSAGSLVDFRKYAGTDSVLSGPAGGVVALERISQSIGSDQSAPIIGLDMGGTSTDVCRLNGSARMKYEAIKANTRVITPTLDIHTVASGGGSICSFDGVQFNVGPQSAGANPGPACYSRSGPLTVTDLNLLTGRLPNDALPFEVSSSAAKNALHDLCKQASIPESDAIELAQGLRQIANEQMAAAVRAITIAEGIEPSGHVLVSFGGAAGQHICEIAAILNVDTIFDPNDAGILSAMGMGLASVARIGATSIYKRRYECNDVELAKEFEAIEAKLIDALHSERLDVSERIIERTIELRTCKTDMSLTVPWSDLTSIASAYHELHRVRYGYSRPELPLEITAIRSSIKVVSAAQWQLPNQAAWKEHVSRLTDGCVTSTSAESEPASIYSNTSWQTASRYNRDELTPNDIIVGPAIICSNSHTMVIEAGWAASVCHDRSLILKMLKSTDITQTAVANDLVLREVIAQRFAAIASQMGIVLEQTAISVNIRDRRDFSCAVFDREGYLIANAPHVPVHLGAMQTTVQHAIKTFPNMQPGDSFITNDPACGGSHLPDITLITPVFVLGTDQLAFFVANRAHHAEIGGIAPGSMAPTATKLIEEGVIIEMSYFTRATCDLTTEVKRMLTEAEYPSRLPNQNMSDLAAQAAANQRGVQALQELMSEIGNDRLQARVEDVLQITQRKVKAWIRSLSPHTCSFEDHLDDGTKIAVKLSFEGSELTVDFTGTGPMSTANFNAGLGIVQAAVMYVVRLMLQDSMPMNSGAMRAIKLNVPKGVLNPEFDVGLSQRPAVAAGNVETSQRVVDVLLGALGVCGASQGTMNNFLMGNASFGFYETIGGGTGATAESDGADAVHSHMTNTRLTDPEVLEQRYPIRLRKLAVRRGSGGSGLHQGGDGMIRQFEFLEDLDVSMITSRRMPHAPYGQSGGSSGQPGVNTHIDRNGIETPLPSSIQRKVMIGESIRMETPGGGGYGKS